MLKQLLNLFLLILSPVFFIGGILIILVLINVIKEYKKGSRFIRKESTYKRNPWYMKVFVQFPRRLAKDIINSNPNHLKDTGLFIFCGEQGSGKTIAAVEFMLRYKKLYKYLKVYTNIAFTHQEGKIIHWRDLIGKNNGEFGMIAFLDEIQTWFSSNESKDFPSEMLTDICQQRKQRKILLGTAQVFSRVAKPIREQTTKIFLPMTFAGCLTIVRMTKPQYWDDEKQKFNRYTGWYFFVHTDVIRNSFDTYEKVERYSQAGFQFPQWRREA